MRLKAVVCFKQKGKELRQLVGCSDILKLQATTSYNAFGLSIGILLYPGCLAIRKNTRTPLLCQQWSSLKKEKDF